MSSVGPGRDLGLLDPNSHPGRKGLLGSVKRWDPDTEVDVYGVVRPTPLLTYFTTSRVVPVEVSTEGDSHKIFLVEEGDGRAHNTTRDTPRVLIGTDSNWSAESGSIQTPAGSRTEPSVK